MRVPLRGVVRSEIGASPPGPKLDGPTSSTSRSRTQDETLRWPTSRRASAFRIRRQGMIGSANSAGHPICPRRDVLVSSLPNTPPTDDGSLSSPATAGDRTVHTARPPARPPIFARRPFKRRSYGTVSGQRLVSPDSNPSSKIRGPQLLPGAKVKPPQPKPPPSTMSNGSAHCSVASSVSKS